jgi:hypothetical protein
MLRRKVRILEEYQSPGKDAAHIYRKGQIEILNSAIQELHRLRLETVAAHSDRFVACAKSERDICDDGSVPVIIGNLQFTGQGVFVNQKTPSDAPLIVIPQEDVLDSCNPSSIAEWKLLDQWAQKTKTGSMVDWTKISPLCWDQDAREAVSASITEALDQRRQELADSACPDYALAARIDGQTLSFEGKLYVLPLPRLPCHHGRASVVWEWREEGLCLVPLQPGGVEPGMQVFCSLEQSCTNEDLLLRHFHCLSESLKQGNNETDCIRLGIPVEDQPWLEHVLALNGDRWRYHQAFDSQTSGAILEQVLELLEANETQWPSVSMQSTIHLFRQTQLDIIDSYHSQ